MKNELINIESSNCYSPDFSDIMIVDFIGEIQMRKTIQPNIEVGSWPFKRLTQLSQKTFRQSANFTLEFIEHSDPMLIGIQIKLMYERLKCDLNEYQKQR